MRVHAGVMTTLLGISVPGAASAEGVDQGPSPDGSERRLARKVSTRTLPIPQVGAAPHTARHRRQGQRVRGSRKPSNCVPSRGGHDLANQLHHAWAGEWNQP